MRGESRRRGERPHDHGERTRALSSRALRLALPVLASAALILVWGLASMTLSGAPAAHAAGTATVAIIVPAPDNGGNAQGPVGAYVSISAQNLNAQDTYVTGVGLAPGGCNAQFIPSGSQGVAPDASGNLVTTIIWPTAAGAVGSSYYVCLQDHVQQGSQPIQSTGTYTVRSGNAPSISIAVPQVGAGTPVPLPQPSPGEFYAGSQITITGQNYTPGGESLAVHLLSGQPTSQNDILSAPTLQTTDNSPITPDGNGGFTATVTLPVPQTTLPAKFYVYVVSQDQQPISGGTTTYPALIGSKAITIVQQPAPTPTPTLTPPTPTAASTPSGGNGNGNNSGGPHNLGAVIGLGVTSVLLFVIGVILLASAASMPRPRP